MSVPKYLVKLPEEGLWVAWLSALSVVVVGVGVALGWDAKLVGGLATLIPLTGRLITGMLLPTPSVPEEVASVKESMNDAPKLGGR